MFANQNSTPPLLPGKISSAVSLALGMSCLALSDTMSAREYSPTASKNRNNSTYILAPTAIFVDKSIKPSKAIKPEDFKLQLAAPSELSEWQNTAVSVSKAEHTKLAQIGVGVAGALLLGGLAARRRRRNHTANITTNGCSNHARTAQGLLLAAPLLLCAAETSAQTTITVCSTAQPSKSEVGGSYFASTQSKLENTSNFGSGGNYCEYEFAFKNLPTEPLTEAQLISEGCDILWVYDLYPWLLDPSTTYVGYDNGENELPEIKNWLDNTNGQLLAECPERKGTFPTGSPSPGRVCEYFGASMYADQVEGPGTSTLDLGSSSCLADVPTSSGAFDNYYMNIFTSHIGFEVIARQDDLAGGTEPSIIANSNKTMVAARYTLTYYNDGYCCLTYGNAITNGNDKLLANLMCHLGAASQGKPNCVGGEDAFLTLTKNVVNDDGGTAVAADWTLSATGPTNVSGPSGDSSVTSAAVDVGVYTLSESVNTDYNQTSLSCTGGADSDPSDGLAIAIGEAITCTFTNDDITATTLTISKVASTNPIIVGQAFSYTITITNTGANEAVNVVVSDAVDVSMSVDNVSTVGGVGGSTTGTSGNLVECTWSSLGVGNTADCIIDVTP